MRQLDLGGGPVEDVLRWARHRSEAILEELGGDPEVILDAMLAGLGHGEFPILDGSGAVPAASVVEALAHAPAEEAPAATSTEELAAPPPAPVADSGVALRVLAELGEGELPGGADTEIAAEVHEGEALDDELDPLAGLVDDDDLPLVPPEPPLAESLGPPLPPGLPDEPTEAAASAAADPSSLAPVTDDDEASLPPVVDDDAANLPPVVDDDEASLPPVVDDDEASLPPVTDDDDATPVAAAPAPTQSLADDLGPPLLPGLDEPSPPLESPVADDAPLDLGPPLLPGFESEELGPPPPQEPSGVHELPGPAPDDRWSGESDWSERSFLLGIPDDETLAAAAAERRRGREDDAPVARRRDASSRSTRAASGKLDAATPPPPPAEPASSGKKDKAADKSAKSGKPAKKDKKSKKKSQGVVVLDKTVRRTRPRTDSAPAAGEEAVEEIDEFEEIDDVELLDE